MIGYPNGKKIRVNHSIKNKSNLGKSLESDLNQSNQYYQVHNIALVHKKPTPITVVEVDYPKRSAAQITKAFYQLPSTTDYNGIYKGIPIDFEAKQTQNLTRIPLSMIHKHQIDHLRRVLEHGGFSFLILRFVLKDETFLLPFCELDDFLKNESDKKSLSYEWIKSKSTLIESSYLIPCHYIKALSTYLGGVNET